MAGWRKLKATRWNKRTNGQQRTGTRRAARVLPEVSVEKQLQGASSFPCSSPGRRASDWEHDSHSDREKWSAVTQAGLSSATTSKQSARNTHSRAISLKGRNTYTSFTDIFSYLLLLWMLKKVNKEEGKTARARRGKRHELAGGPRGSSRTTGHSTHSVVWSTDSVHEASGAQTMHIRSTCLFQNKIFILVLLVKGVNYFENQLPLSKLWLLGTPTPSTRPYYFTAWCLLLTGSSCINFPCVETVLHSWLKIKLNLCVLPPSPLHTYIQNTQKKSI